MMRVKGAHSVIFFLLVLVLFSCSDPGGILPNPSQGEANLSTLAEGSVLTQGDAIPLLVEFNKEQITPDKLEITLYDASGQLLDSQTISGIDIEDKWLLPVSLTKTGLYKIHFALWEEGRMILEKTVDFFYTDQEYRIKGIISYPPVLLPDSSVLLQALLQVPADSAAYLRWTLGGKIIQEGYLKDGLDKLQWHSPRSEGVYSLKVELYPTGPDDGKGFGFSSQNFLSTEIFVSDSGAEIAGEFQPQESFFSLFHFRGNIADTGTRPHKGKLEILGSADLEVRKGALGFYSNGQTGIRVPEALLPGSNGRLLPFSLEMKLVLDNRQREEPGKKNFFTILSGTGTAVLQLFEDAGGQFKLLFNLDNREDAVVDLNKNGLPLDEAVEFILSVIPGKDQVTVLYYENGELLSVHDFPVNMGGVTLDGTSVLAGENGFYGILDEFGIYYKDEEGRNSVDPYVYKNGLEEKYGTDLVYAEGFDGLYPASAWQVSGEAELVNSSLVLAAESSVVFPVISTGWEEVFCGIELESRDDQGQIILETGDGTALVRFQGDGSVVVKGKEIAPANGAGLPTAMVLLRKKEGVLVTWDNGETLLEDSGFQKQGFRFRIANRGSKKLPIQSFVIREKGESLLTNKENSEGNMLLQEKEKKSFGA